MNNFLLILSGFAFLISFGSWAHFERQTKGENVRFKSSAIGSLIIALVPFLSFVFLNLILNKLSDFHWFWLLIVSIIIMPLLGSPLTEIYSSVFGYKITKKIDLRTGDINKKINVHMIDAFISFGVGIVLYVIGK